MTNRLGSSEWSVPEARSVVAQLRHVATDSPEYDGVELFLALCDYLDQLHGSPGFDQVLPDDQRAALARVVQRVRGKSAVPEEDGERLIQPVNAAVTLADGRVLAAHLESSDGWQRELGRALQGLFSYLDQLYGGPGAFTELLTSDERERVARR
jgi:glutathione S-transferase